MIGGFLSNELISTVADLFDDEAAAVVVEVEVVDIFLVGSRSEMEAHLRNYW